MNPMIESPDLDSVTHDILHLKSSIHNHQVFIRGLQNKQKTPDINQKIDYHKNVINNLEDQLKKKQDRLYQLRHSFPMTKVQRLLKLVGEIAAAGASGGAKGSSGGASRGGQVSVNNLGQIPVVPLKWKKKSKP